MEERYNIQFFYNLDKSFTEMLQMILAVYSDSVLSRTHVYKWYSWFKGGREIVEDQPSSEHPSTSINDNNVEKVHAVVRGDRRLTTQ